MKIISLNVCRLGPPQAFKAFSRLLKVEGLDMVFLMETKLHVKNLERFQLRLQMVGCFGVDRKGLNGGLALFWKE